MPSIQTLQAGQCYRVVQAFTDYDGGRHPVGEHWEFVSTGFLPYEDGLTLHVLCHGLPCTYRLQWRLEQQGALIKDFTSYVLPC